MLSNFVRGLFRCQLPARALHNSVVMNSNSERTVAQTTGAVDPEVDAVHLRPFTPADLEAAQALSREVQWPHRPEDWRFVSALGAGVVAECRGQLVGTAHCWKWPDRRATLGMVIVAPPMQGRRIGAQMMRALLDDLAQFDVSLHATAEGRALYERLGFVALGEVRQHQGMAHPAPLAAMTPGHRLRPLGRADVDRLVELDAAASGMARGEAVRALIADAQGIVLDRDGEPVGFSLLRRFGRGYAIGPVVAPDASGARALIAHWTSQCAGKFLRIDVEASSGLVDWLEDQGLHRAGSVEMMTRGTPPRRGPASGLYALINQALG